MREALIVIWEASDRICGKRLRPLVPIMRAAGESLGMDRHLKVNTTKRRTHSLFRQGCMLYDLIPNMPEVRLRPLIARFREYLNEHGAFNETFSFV